MKWIFGSFSRDALFLMVPGLAALAFARFDLFQESLPYALLVTVFADSGHVYTTAWRTWFHPTERRRSITSWTVPLGLLLGFFMWGLSGAPYMWSFVIYINIHHNLKQYYGITRWYETLNRHSLKWSGYLSRALMIIPVIAYHFRHDAMTGFLGPKDFLLMPNETLFQISTAVYLVTLATWIGLEILNFARGYREWNRVLSIALSSSLYGGAFFFGRTVPEVVFPPVFGHGMGYIALVGLTLHKTRRRMFPTFAKGFAVICATALAFGAFEQFFERGYLEEALVNTGWLYSAYVAFYLVPQFSHFIYDSWLWKRTHWESRLVYDLTAKRGDVVAIEPSNASPAASQSERAS